MSEEDGNQAPNKEFKQKIGEAGVRIYEIPAHMPHLIFIWPAEGAAPCQMIRRGALTPQLAVALNYLKALVEVETKVELMPSKQSNIVVPGRPH